MRTWVSMLACVAIVVIAQRAHAADGIYGYWKSSDKETGRAQSVFVLSEENGGLIGRVVKVFPKPGEDNKTKLGTKLLWGFTRVKDNPRKWVDGKILNPENGKTYGAELELSEDGSKLNVYGYIRILFKIGGSNVWVRTSQAELSGVAP